MKSKTISATRAFIGNFSANVDRKENSGDVIKDDCCEMEHNRDDESNKVRH